MFRPLLAVLALALCACATPSSSDSTTAQKPAEEKEYRTGSRIPVRDPSASSSPTSIASPSAMSPSAPPPVPR